ncbi:hypothetical protein F383_12857 [Gossypium arboreum]|uniref:Uncharacterized protein n=1 Tax=Gossypium arboreum TaxID=29729 RepID=A0A0B0NC23_GOSAR|nr:hypothetical protein F383_12857 [Gossypium arboreum]
MALVAVNKDQYATAKQSTLFGSALLEHPSKPVPEPLNQKDNTERHEINLPPQIYIENKQQCRLLV